MTTAAKTDTVWFSSRGQLVIPAWLRRAFHIERGTRVVVTATADGILLKPVTSAMIDRGFGLLKSSARRKPFAAEWADHKRENRELENAKYARHRA